MGIFIILIKINIATKNAIIKIEHLSDSENLFPAKLVWRSNKCLQKKNIA